MIEIKPSNIHGKGAFAVEFIPEGTIFVYDVITIQKGIQDDVIKYTFPFDMNYYCICIGASTYFNHSAKPNMKIHRLDKENLK